jgi:hypothetical protein
MRYNLRYYSAILPGGDEENHENLMTVRLLRNISDALPLEPKQEGICYQILLHT